MSSDYPSIAEKNPGYSEQNRESERKKKKFFFFHFHNPPHTTGGGGNKNKNKNRPATAETSFPSLPVPPRNAFPRVESPSAGEHRKDGKPRQTERCCVSHTFRGMAGPMAGLMADSKNRTWGMRN